MSVIGLMKNDNQCHLDDVLFSFKDERANSFVVTHAHLNITVMLLAISSENAMKAMTLVFRYLPNAE